MTFKYKDTSLKKAMKTENKKVWKETTDQSSVAIALTTRTSHAVIDSVCPRSAKPVELWRQQQHSTNRA
jgi:hypothetical protein